MDKKIFLLINILLISSSYLFSNAITVSNLIVDAPNQEVTVDLEWKNSWRMDSLSAPFNWDAAWVFVKFSECDSLSFNFAPDWEHGKIDSVITNNSFGNLEPVLNNGTVGIADSLGVMLRRNSNGFFTNEIGTTITLKVANLDPSKAYHLRVVAIEMIYVTEGSFEIGGITGDNSFNTATISNENATTITTSASGSNSSISLSANYPKGYESFHCMKYEISEGQYATFLNTLNPTQATSRYYANTTYRHRLTNTGTNQFETYVSDREDRACGWINWDDILSYLDWAGMRPMTELQFEKACRGTATTVTDEYAWGTTYINDGNTFTGAENGTEYFVDPTANCVYNNITYTGGDGDRGSARCGIFALPTNTTREQSGATFYGIMEMSGNHWESIVNVSDATGTTNYDGLNGDGYLDASGLYNTTNWPLNGNGTGLRGGSFPDAATRIRLASRIYYSWSNTTSSKNSNIGGRGIR